MRHTEHRPRRTLGTISILDAELGNTFQPFVQCNSEFASGQVRAQTAVGTHSEGYVAVDLAIDINVQRVSELFVVKVGQCCRQRKTITLFYLYTIKLQVSVRDALH